MSGRRKRKHETLEYRDAELNIMPFIDVFSVLNTFLLMSAVFVGFGIVKVQIPFLSNKEVPEKPKRTLSVNVELDKEKAVLVSRFSMPPVNEEKNTYTIDDAGMTAMHEKLVQIRSANKDTDLVTVFSEDEVLYEQIIKVIDTIKVRRDKDPVFVSEEADESDVINRSYLYPKVVMGSVIL